MMGSTSTSFIPKIIIARCHRLWGKSRPRSSLTSTRSSFHLHRWSYYSSTSCMCDIHEDADKLIESIYNKGGKPLFIHEKKTVDADEAQNRRSSRGDGKSFFKKFPPIDIPKSLLTPIGCVVQDELNSKITKDGNFCSSSKHIPFVSLHDLDAFANKRVLVLCTGGTLTMAPDEKQDGSLAPVEGALTNYLKNMPELQSSNMPDVFVHEYKPLLDSSDMGPSDWAVLARDIQSNYLYFDGFVIVYGTDTMAYAASALSFMLENLGKPVVFTGSQIPLCEPYNDARRNFIMALIFASRQPTIPEVSIFFHDRLLRAVRSTKVNTHLLMAFDSPNMEPLAKIGINIEENEHLLLPPARGALRVHTKMDTRTLTLRLVPGFDDGMIRAIISAAKETHVRALVLQLYGTGNVPSIKRDLRDMLGEAIEGGTLVVANTQCHVGHVMMGHYATGRALVEAGVVSANDMTVEAISCKLAYLFGRNDLSQIEVSDLMGVSLRGEITHSNSLPPPPLSSAYQRASRKGRRYF